jgi:acyl-coenzyme A synthetase/AMP-(fatty) acid ligase
VPTTLKDTGTEDVLDCFSAIAKTTSAGDCIWLFYMGITDLSIKLRKQMSSQLKSHFLPTKFVRVDEIPRSRTGKINRQIAFTLLSKRMDK